MKRVQRLIALVLTLAASTTAVYAGSCTDEIDRIEAFISAQLGTALAEVQR